MSKMPEPNSIPADVPASPPCLTITFTNEGKSPAKEIQLTGALRELLVSLTRGRPVGSLPAKLNVVQLIWGERDLSHLAKELTVDGAKITVSCGGEVSGEAVQELRWMEEDTLRGQPIHGRVEGGLRFRAEFGGHSGSTYGSSASATTVSYVQFLSAFNWQLVLESGTPSLWFARVRGPLGHIRGNLRVTFHQGPSSSSSSMRGLRLEGAYTYYLLSGYNTKDWYLVIDTAGAGAPSQNFLWCDVLALQFALGRQLKVDTLYGVDESGVVVAWACGEHGADHPGSQVEPPVPPVNMTTPTWTVPFFSAVSDLMRNRTEVRPGVALLTYLDSLTDNVDAAFIRLAVGLEGFAFWLLAGKPDEIIVNDKKAWLTWAKKHEAEIRALAKDEKLANKLYGKIEGAFKRASGKVVQDAFASLGLTPTKEMDEILDLRDYAIHRGVMLKEGQTYEVDREVSNIAKARVMLVALVARVAGYCGAISGWGKPDGGRYPVLDGFWEVSQESLNAERVFYVASDGGETATSPVASALAPESPQRSAVD